MAKETSRTFDRAKGAVHVSIEDDFGVVSVHTVYVARVPDVSAAVAKALSDADASAQAMQERMVAAGWVQQSDAK